MNRPITVSEFHRSGRPMSRLGKAVLTVLWVTLGLCLLSLTGCTNGEGASEALRAAGYTKIAITGWSPLSCSNSDGTCTGFVAVGPSGRTVTGAVGCGYVFKGCTVRVTGSR